MRIKPRGPVRLLALAVAAGLFVAACGTDDDSAAGTGSVVISGSSTVEPISAANGEKFASVNPGVRISVDGPGTGDGFQLFCAGDTDISDASRAIKEEEAEVCEQNGIEFIELKVAIDGLSVITSQANDQVECLDFLDLYALLGLESQGFDKWSDADELGRELGAGNAPYPNSRLQITAPGEESGTFDSFAEIVLEDTAEERGQEPDPRPDYQASADDNVIVEGIAGNDTSLGWVGYAFFVQNPDRVKALSITEEPGGRCVEPTPETISSGDYPIARDLFIYVNAQKMEANPSLQSYVDFYLSDDGMASVAEVGYIDLAPEALAETRATWESKETGTREG
jgi:phosphate transport system substrate-binding protein